MRWIYWIPHEWQEEVTNWEDIWLMPSIRSVNSESIWLTVDTAWDDDTEELGIFDGVSYSVWGDNMYVKSPSFTKVELLSFAALWLKINGYDASGLIEGCYQDFANTNEHS